MIDLPDIEKAFQYENDFYLSCHPSRMGKFIAHYGLFRRTWALSGAIVECGVFKGVSLARFAMFRSLFGPPASKKIIGFDTFDVFPETAFEGDKGPRGKFIREAGAKSISEQQLYEVLERKGCRENVELVAGDACDSIPRYVEDHSGLKISLLHLDVDIFEPSVAVMKHLFPRLVPGGILIIDDYGRFPGETKAVDDAIEGTGLRIEKFSFCETPCFLVVP